MPAWVRTHLFDAAPPDRVRAELAASLPGPAALVVVFASPEHPLGAVCTALSADHPTVVGCSSAGEFVGARETKGGLAVFAVGGDVAASAGLGRGLRASPTSAVRAALAGQPRELPGKPHRTGILLLDPLAGVSEEVALLTAEELGDIPLAGGAAGDDLHMKETTVAFGTETATDAVVVVQLFTAERLGLGVRHGHTPMSRPLTVTAAEGPIVLELDGEPAWEVWKRETRATAASAGIDVDRLTDDDVGGFLLRFEAGLSTLGATKVRAPLRRVAAGGIAFAADVPAGSVIRITEGTASSQVDSAYLAAKEARAALGGAPVAGALVFDCICRNLILGPDFGRAIERMSEALGGAPLAGFETYGEVALHAGALSGFHNTTSVVLAFPGEDG